MDYVDKVAWIFVGALVVGVAYNLYGLHRNEKVYDFRIKLLNEVCRLGRLDELEGKNPLWRVKVLETVDYDTMLNKFWVPLEPENFYKDTSFLK